MTTTIVNVCRFEYDKGGITKPYYQIVLSTDYGYNVKKVTCELYTKILEMGLPIQVKRLLYDEHYKVCEVEYY